VAQRATVWAAGTGGTLAAIAVLGSWLLAGPFLGWTETWFYVNAMINSAMFVLLFLLHRTQAKDNLAIQVKLNELLAAVDRASPRLINIEDLGEEEIRRLHQQYQELQTTDHGPHSIHEDDPGT
jgi:low affinity Fe/Cu permease